MHIYRDTVALMSAVSTVNRSENDPQLQGLIAKRLQDLADYGESLSELIHILVIEPSDALTDVDVQLGFSLSARLWDLVESHTHWYEITVVVSDDGFGWVIYLPKSSEHHGDLLQRCAIEAQESMP